MSQFHIGVKALFFAPSSLRCLWPPCLHRQRSGGARKVGGVWTADHRPIWGGAPALLHYLHPQGEQHGGVQEDRLVVHSSIQWPVYCAIFCPLEIKFTLPSSTSLVCISVPSCVCWGPSVFSFWSSLFFSWKMWRQPVIVRTDVNISLQQSFECQYHLCLSFLSYFP